MRLLSGSLIYARTVIQPGAIFIGDYLTKGGYTPLLLKLRTEYGVLVELYTDDTD